MSSGTWLDPRPPLRQTLTAVHVAALARAVVSMELGEMADARAHAVTVADTASLAVGHPAHGELAGYAAEAAERAAVVVHTVEVAREAIEILCREVER